MADRSKLLLRSTFLLLFALHVQTNRCLIGVDWFFGLRSLPSPVVIGISNFNHFCNHAVKLNEVPLRGKKESNLLVHPDDFIYRYDPGEWDSAPIVIPHYKLLFFSVPKVGCTTFKILFRRMMGAKDYMKQDGRTGQPHNPKVNGLSYLWNYTIDEANHMMTSPEYTRAIFVRDPKARFVSAYLDKAVANHDTFLIPKCCKQSHDSCRDASKTAMAFMTLIENCTNSHWEPHTYRMESKYWKYINFVGHLETMQEDVTRLLEHIGAAKYSKMGGWGKGSHTRIFSVSDKQTHVTNSAARLNNIYDSPELEREVEKYYAEDYANGIFGFEKIRSIATL